MDCNKDYYTILGVPANASAEEIRSAYRQMAKLHHPDKNPGDDQANARFQEINEAYAVLIDPLSRQLYDEHRQEEAKLNKAQKDKEQPAAQGFQPNEERKSRTYTVHKEKRIYVEGDIEVKFQGDPDIAFNEHSAWEHRFTLTATEVLVTITSSAIHRDMPPAEYQQSVAATDLFRTPLSQPILCRVVAADQEALYRLELYDIRVKEPRITHITRHEQYSFGTLEGKLYAYTVFSYTEVVTENYTVYSGMTGKLETKTENGTVYVRNEFYAGDGTTYWGEWRWKKVPVRPAPVAPVRPAQANNENAWGCLGLLLLIGLFWKPLLLVVLPVILVMLTTSIAGWLLGSFRNIFRVLVGLVLGTMLIAGIASIFLPPSSIRTLRRSGGDSSDSISTERTAVIDSSQTNDTLITHRLHWSDYDSNAYDISLTVSASAVRRAAVLHADMNEAAYAQEGIANVYAAMLHFDDDAVYKLAKVFDSLASSRQLTRNEQAKMVVSCIQSIPYSLVVDRACTDKYADNYIQQYLGQCDGDCCKGYAKFGVQSPVEFVADLKGDCDTRVLFLYAMLGKLGYKTALLTSSHYKHALLAVSLDKSAEPGEGTVHIDENTYYLWETTSRGFRPGAIPSNINNLRYWNLSLIQ